MNPAHQILKAIGAGHYCGVWEKRSKRNTSTPKKSAEEITKARDKAFFKAHNVIQRYFTSKQKASLDSKKKS